MNEVEHLDAAYEHLAELQFRIGGWRTRRAQNPVIQQLSMNGLISEAQLHLANAMDSAKSKASA